MQNVQNKISIADRILGNCEKGIHSFSTFLVHKIPPRIDALAGVKTNVYGMEVILTLLTEEISEIRCTRCGKKAE